MQDLKWWAEGDLLDACNCDLICPCHVSFKQNATSDTCEAIWGVNIERGEWGQTRLDGLKAVIVAFVPQPLMIDGGWTSLLYIDDKATPAQEEALTGILSGTRGGPWSKLAVFFADGKYKVVQRATIEFAKEKGARHIKVPGMVSLDIEAIRSVNPDEEVKLKNLRNVIHGNEHVISHSTHTVDDQGIQWENVGKNGTAPFDGTGLSKAREYRLRDRRQEFRS